MALSAPVGCRGCSDCIAELGDAGSTTTGEFTDAACQGGVEAPNLHVAAEASGGTFKIAGGAAGLKVSWLITGVRQDAWAKANPMAVEEDKAAADKGCQEQRRRSLRRRFDHRRRTRKREGRRAHLTRPCAR